MANPVDEPDPLGDLTFGEDEVVEMAEPVDETTGVSVDLAAKNQKKKPAKKQAQQQPEPDNTPKRPSFGVSVSAYGDAPATQPSGIADLRDDVRRVLTSLEALSETLRKTYEKIIETVDKIDNNKAKFGE